MSTNKLYLFSKDTDATATEKGYHYQKLKTLKTWLQNRIAGSDEVIYCDYGDDIVQRNFAAGTSKFRQVKLYSSNFSFSTEEITKSLANFFMLFTKGDYLFDESTFVFETNALIAKETRGNDADLLRQWEARQGAMDDELLKRVIARVQVIMDTYIHDGYDKEKQKDNDGDFLQAKNFYEQLPESFWTQFVLAVHWQFDGVSQEDAILGLVEEIQALILQLPLPIVEKQVSTYLAVLHYEIARRTTEVEPDNRTLTNELLDILVLNKGTERDQWYAEVYRKWSTVSAIPNFSIGMFLEVIDATRHCRWNMHGSSHALLWLKLLKCYIELVDIPMVFKRKAIYEYLFLKMSTDMVAMIPTGSITDEPALVGEYFDHLEERYAIANIEEDIILMQVVTAQRMRAPGFLEDSEVERWSEQITATIEEKLRLPRDVNELCLLLELKGTAFMQLRMGSSKPDTVKAAMMIFRKIIPLLPEAKFYTISKLSDVLGQLIKMYIRVGNNYEDIIDEIEAFLFEISDAAMQTSKRHSEAHSFVERGVAYLEKGGSRNFLRALDSFHKADRLWLMSETTDGHILALLNTAQVYNALGANLAGKYFGLCAIWSALNIGDQSSLKRISDGYALVFYADFRQGAWISALGDYLPFMNSRQDLKPEGIGKDDMVIKSFINLLVILESAKKVQPEMLRYIDFYKTQLGDFYESDMQHLVVLMKEHIEGEHNMEQFSADRTDDQAFNDAGPQRTIRFKMLAVEWRVNFENTYVITAVAEELCALFQGMLCEIGLSGRDLRLISATININVTRSGECVVMTKMVQKAPDTWSLEIPNHNEHDPAIAQVRYFSLAANIKSILTVLSQLPSADVDDLFDHLYKKQKLSGKGLSVTSYQYAYFTSFDEDSFNRSQRQYFHGPTNRFGRVLSDKLSVALASD